MDIVMNDDDQPTSLDGHKILRRTRREILHQLTRDEEHAYGQKLAREERAWDVLDAKRKDVVAQFKGELSKISTEIARLTSALNAHEELRNTEVLDVLVGSQVVTYRADTLEVVDQRPASYADAQEDMFPSDEDAVGDAIEDEPVGEMAVSAVGDAVFIGGDGEETEDEAPKPKKAKGGKGKARK